MQLDGRSAVYAAFAGATGPTPGDDLYSCSEGPHKEGKTVENAVIRRPAMLPACVVAVLALFLAPTPSRGEHPGQKNSLPSSEEIAMLPADGGEEFNRLIHEKSPYLLQHARNPVDWYAWGKEAFEKATREDKPVFLSVGYSTCHWCHVMAHESFEHEDVAEILNAHFVAIKVDREERPDLDEIYMTATQLLTGRGGWPNSVWLTPDGHPWYAGTYFPREDRGGMVGFKTLLLRLKDIWKEKRRDVESQATQVAEAIKRTSSNGAAGTSRDVSPEAVDRAIEELRHTFDKERGGFGGAPKFPPHAGLRLLLYEYDRTREQALLDMITGTLDAIALGGIHDHVGGGFHRYSTDDRWFLPHFEKMLYDNAQLARAYCESYALTGNEEHRRVATGIFAWIAREMTDAGGAFYSALDADSEGEEGKCYLWGTDELVAILGKKEGMFFRRVFNAAREGNFRDEATARRPGTNILYLGEKIENIASAEKTTPRALRERIDRSLAKLLSARAERVQPQLDDKVLVSWNGLMIGSLAYASTHLKAPDYAGRAAKAADFILSSMRRDGRLLRTYRDGTARLNAYAEDYAFLADGLLDLHEATGEERWLVEAASLASELIEHYWDDDGGGFFFTSADHERLLIRSKDAVDKAIPSGNGQAARVLVRLAALTGDPRYVRRAQETIRAFAGVVDRFPRATQTMILATAMLSNTRHSGPVSVRINADGLEARQGETVTVSIVIAVEEGWHVNSNSPLQGHLVPTAVTLRPSRVFPSVKMTYPDGKRVKLGFSDDELSLYEGNVTVRASLRVAADAPTGKAPVTFEARYQPCNDRSCLRESTTRVGTTIKISPQ